MTNRLVLTIFACTLPSLALAQAVSDIELGRALDACSQHQAASTPDGVATPYAAGWEHCEKIRAEFLRRKSTPTASPDLDITKSAAGKLK